MFPFCYEDLKSMRIIGLFLIVASLLAPLYWYVPLADRYPFGAIFSQYLGSAALIAMGIVQLFATRARWLEPLFGGLDRIYVQHKWLGIIAMVAVLLHDTIDAEINNIGRETALIDLAETLGEISLYGLLILVVITITTFIPYHLWKWTHKLMGGFFALSAFHYLFILKPFDNIDPLGLYVLSFCVVGIFCYIYTLLPERSVRLKHAYSVSNLERTAGSLSVELAPIGKGFRHKAGQFAFISFDSDGLNEVHPYTISKRSTEDRSLRFTIKPLGDHTHQLQKSLQPGMTAKVQGPFGHFRRPTGNAPQIWIAAGVGITPFLAWAQELSETTSPQETHLFYCVRNEAEAAHLEELKSLAEGKSGFTLHLWQSEQEGRLDAEKILARTQTDPTKSYVAFCGPEAMRKALKDAFSSRGVSSKRFLYEEFEIRSDIGLWKLVAWLYHSLRSETQMRLAAR